MTSRLENKIATESIYQAYHSVKNREKILTDCEYVRNLHSLESMPIFKKIAFSLEPIALQQNLDISISFPGRLMSIDFGNVSYTLYTQSFGGLPNFVFNLPHIGFKRKLN
jgi:hypothetical protein